MSAFIVSNHHIASLMNFARHHGVSVTHNDRRWVCRNPEDYATLGQILTNQNYLSVNARYNESSEPDNFRSVPTPATPAVQILKACACYDYQACETDDYPETLACKLIIAIRHAAINVLPGYDDAAWEITKPEPVTVVILA